MDKIIAEQIMYCKWHQFLYGYNSEMRTNFLKEIEEDYPIVCGSDLPMGIYLEPYGISSEDKKIEDELLSMTTREYLKNVIAYSIIKRIENNSLVMGHIENQLLDFLNSYMFYRKEKVSSVSNYLNELEEILNICLENYNSVLSNGTVHPLMGDFPSDFFDIESFGKSLKNILNNNGQFNIIIDYNNSVTLNSLKSIMSVVNSRCAGVICMKIATDYEKWSTYSDLYGNFVQYIHDYEIVELDDSYQKVLNNRLKRFYDN